MESDELIKQRLIEMGVNPHSLEAAIIVALWASEAKE